MPIISGISIISGRSVVSGMPIVCGTGSGSEIRVVSSLSVVSGKRVVSSPSSCSGTWVVVGIRIVICVSVVSGTSSDVGIVGRGASGSGSSSDIGDDTNGPSSVSTGCVEVTIRALDVDRSGASIVSGNEGISDINRITDSALSGIGIGDPMKSLGSAGRSRFDSNGVPDLMADVAIRALGVDRSSEWVVSGNEGISDISLITDSALSGIGIGDPIKSLGSARLDCTEFMDVAIRPLAVGRSGNSVVTRDPLDDPGCEVDLDVVGFATAVGSCIVLLTGFNCLCSPSVVLFEGEEC
ncbi:hypothetical protein FIE12Z_8004 [Fusarium flagelliforme]|uniref:Uncharacterized protein n=1 Tax=Fusarium flagelliforme TaxID=2675880 RepID=A0A395MJ04_9HYPO|nr:hypothetical protein FIE12Z_8004 [Fusarium flagelliforme]